MLRRSSSGSSTSELPGTRAMDLPITSMHGSVGHAHEWAAPRCVTELGISARRIMELADRDADHVTADEW